jgi:hypothetical protein
MNAKAKTLPNEPRFWTRASLESAYGSLIAQDNRWLANLPKHLIEGKEVKTDGFEAKTSIVASR